MAVAKSKRTGPPFLWNIFDFDHRYLHAREHLKEASVDCRRPKFPLLQDQHPSQKVAIGKAAYGCLRSRMNATAECRKFHAPVLSGVILR